METKPQALCTKLIEILRQHASTWHLREQALFEGHQWCGIEVITPSMALTDEIKNQMRDVFANNVPSWAWAAGYNEIRFCEEAAELWNESTS